MPDQRILNTEIRKDLADLRIDLQASTAGRSRLSNIVTIIGIIGVILWGACIGLIIMISNLSAKADLSNRLDLEILKGQCFSYHERTGKISPVCKKSEFVTPDGTASK